MLEQNIYALWVGKQVAKGTPNVTGTKRLVQVAGDFNMPRDDGQEAHSDLEKYGDFTDWVNSLVGNGAPGSEATPDELAYQLWLHHGAETVTNITGPPVKKKHTFVPTLGVGFPHTYIKRLGQTQVQRMQFNDCYSSQLVIEGSTANKAVRVTPTVLSLDPGEVRTSDPAGAKPVKDPFLYTDGTSRFTIDGVAIPGHSQFNLTINEDLQLPYGDDILAIDVVPGNAVVTIGVTLYFDADGLAQWNKMVYGLAAPPLGTKPIKRLGPLGSYSYWLKAKDTAGALNGDEFKLVVPGAKWTVPDSPGPNPAGGIPEISLAGAMRKVTGQPGYTIDVNCDDAAFTV